MEKIDLEYIGLTPRESYVYKALLVLDLTTVGPLVKESGIPSSKIYETLDRLMAKGFVSTIIKNGRKHFQASPPEQILAFIEEKKEKIKKELIPQLKILQVGRNHYEATLYEGKGGIKAIYERMLLETKKGETIQVIGAPLRAQELFQDYIFHWNNRRVHNKVKLRIIYTLEAKSYGRIRSKLGLTKVKHLKEDNLAPAWVDIFGDCVVIFDLSQDTPRAFLIKSPSVASNYRNYFEIMWKNAKVIN